MITLATLEQASAQEVFDQVKNHLIKQNEVCEIEGTCHYRSTKEDGTVLKCAAGCLISDEEIIELDKKGASMSFPWRMLVSDFGVTDEHLDLIEALQRVHDQSDPETWDENLLGVANKFALND